VLTALNTAIALVIPVFVAMDPISAVTLVSAWMGDLPVAERRRQLRDALVTALALGAIFIVGGRWLLTILGVDVNDFLIAGGLVLLALAVSDLVAGGGHEGRGSLPSPDLGVVPIGTPLLVGPATLTTLIVLSDRYGILLTAAAFLANVLLAWRLFLGAQSITSLFGRNGLRAASKVVSLLLAAIAVKLIRDGITSLAP
jgi:multiple antibiotic resistance protein